MHSANKLNRPPNTPGIIKDEIEQLLLRSPVPAKIQDVGCKLMKANFDK